MGLWATIHSCEEELRHSSFDYSYIIVANGETNKSAEVLNLGHFLGKAERLRQFAVHPEPMSPPQARQFGTYFADGKYIFFLDNHCLVGRDYFRRAIADFEHYGMDMLHSTTRFYQGDNWHYHYKLTLEKNFWAESATLPKDEVRPYRIAVGGHGGFAVRTDVWREVGGYGPTSLFKGYGGEEVYFDMKMWMLGKTNYLDPKVVHYHYAGARGYPRHYTDEYYINMMACANVIGGEKWVNKVFNSFSRSLKVKSENSMYDLMMQATYRSAHHAKELAAIRQKSLDELLAWFDSNDIAK